MLSQLEFSSLSLALFASWEKWKLFAVKHAVGANRTRRVELLMAIFFHFDSRRGGKRENCTGHGSLAPSGKTSLFLLLLCSPLHSDNFPILMSDDKLRSVTISFRFRSGIGPG